MCIIAVCIIVEVPKELQESKKLPKRLPTLGPLESMQMMMEIQTYMRRAAEDPSLLLVQGFFAEVDTKRPWTELFYWWGEYSHFIHEQGGGDSVKLSGLHADLSLRT